MASNRAELAALKQMIAEADLIFETLPALPENRIALCRELLKTALALTDDLIKQAKLPAAKALGRKGALSLQSAALIISVSLLHGARTHGGGRPLEGVTKVIEVPA